ncbi:MobA/MobL family protein, partial [Neisseria gonorrhoeae]|uniref:MobA/MobL family protein n=1 Tax=Neisseria gonorrhoeae TaxID=485 RepID=UPI001C9991E1
RIDERSYKEQGIEQAPRARIDRVTWQELKRLEQEERQIVQELALKGQEINKEKSYLQKIEEKQAQGMGKYE